MECILYVIVISFQRPLRYVGNSETQCFIDVVCMYFRRQSMNARCYYIRFRFHNVDSDSCYARGVKELFVYNFYCE